MAIPRQMNLYMTTTAFPGSNHGGLSETVPANATTAFGWNVGLAATNAAGKICPMDFGVEVSRTATNPVWATTLTGSGPNNVIGDSWVYGPLEGDFDASQWQVTWSLKSVTLAGTQLGRFLFRVYKSPSPLLGGVAQTPYLISSSWISGSTPATTSYFATSITPSMAATTTQNRCTQSFALGPMQFRNEYLMFQTFFNLTTAGNGNNCDADYIIGAQSGSIKTANFTQYGMDFIRQNSDDLG